MTLETQRILLMGLAALGLSCLTPVVAQIQDLATTDDGGVLFFSTTLRRKGTTEFSNGKIYGYSGGTFELVAQVTPIVTLNDGSEFHFAYRRPSVSGDGAILTLDGTASCWGGPRCLGSLNTRGLVVGADLPTEMTALGSLRVSRNGRYFLRFGGYENAGAPVLFDSELATTRRIRACSEAGRYAAGLGDGRYALDDDGMVVNELCTSRLASHARISADGSTLVYEAATTVACRGGALFKTGEYYQTLYAVDRTTGIERELDRSPLLNSTGSSYCRTTPYFLPTLSGDGRAVLYRQRLGDEGPAQAVIAHTDGSERRSLTNEPVGIAEVLLSGDAGRAFAVTGAGGLLTIDLANGGVGRLLPDAPFITGAPGQAEPGALMVLRGVRLAGAEVAIKGGTAAVIALSDTELAIRLPRDLKVNVTVTVAHPHSPFEHAVEIPVASTSPL